MKNWQKGLAVAFIHILIVLSLGAKLLYDRAHRPRVWVRTASFDPDLPIRGRYLTLNLEVQAPGFEVNAPVAAPIVKNTRPTPQYYNDDIELVVENGQLVARKTDKHTDMHVQWWPSRQGRDAFVLSSPVSFFVAEHAEAPHLNTITGDELWAEVTIPRKGPPRPIQLAMKRGAQWTPLNYR